MVGRDVAISVVGRAIPWSDTSENGGAKRRRRT
jgi:hypothetical protein